MSDTTPANSTDRPESTTDPAQPASVDSVDASASYWDVTTPPIKDAVELAVDPVSVSPASVADPVAAADPLLASPTLGVGADVTEVAPVISGLSAGDVPNASIPPATVGQSSLDLTPDPWTPTAPANEYLGLSNPTPVTPPSTPLPPYGQSMGSVPAYGQDPSSASVSPDRSNGYTSYPQTSYAQTAPVGSSMPSYGQSAPYDQGASYGGSSYGQPETGYSNYQNYASSSQAPPQPIYPTPAPVVYAGAMMLAPGQMIQTPFGPRMVGTKSKLAAGLLGIFLGAFGVGRFYRGFVGLGVLQLVANIFFGAGALWALIEGIVVLCSSPGSPSSLDSEGRLMA